MDKPFRSGRNDGHEPILEASRTRLYCRSQLVAGHPAAAQPPSTPSRPASVGGDQITAYIAEASQRFGIPDAWLSAVIRVESGGEVGITSSAGAMGLMQVMPQTYAIMRARLGLGANAYDPHDNIIAGAAYLREMHDRYGDGGFLAAYNAGPGRYEEYRAGGRSLPSETILYMARLGPMLGVAVNPMQLVVVPASVPKPDEAPIFVLLGGHNAASRTRQNPPPNVQLAMTGPTADERANGVFTARAAELDNHVAAESRALFQAIQSQSERKFSPGFARKGDQAGGIFVRRGLVQNAP